MSEIRALDNLVDNIWDIIEVDTAPHYADLRIGFTKNEPVVNFDNLKFGFELGQDNNILDSKQWPPHGVRYRRTDQVFIVNHRLKFQPDQTYQLHVWAENAGVYVERTHEFTTPIPSQPYSSWTWNGSTWNAPTDYPNDGNDYEWNEQTLSWEPFTEL